MRKLLLAILLIGFSFGSGVHSPASAYQTPSLIIWHSWLDHDGELLNQWVSDYQKVNPTPEIKLEFVGGDLRNAVLEAIRIDRGPDLFIGYSGWVTSLAELKRIAPLDSRIDSRLRSQVDSNLWDTVRAEDFIYGIPLGVQTINFYYNTTFTIGDTLPFTAAELFKAQAAISFDLYTTSGLYTGLGGNSLKARVSVTELERDPGLFAYLTLIGGAYQDYRAANLTAPNTFIVTDQRFRDGRTPYLIDGSWKYRELEGFLPGKLGVAQLPDVEIGKTWRPFVYTEVFYFNINANQPDAALNFVRYATGVEGQIALSKIARRIPVNPGAESGVEPNFQVMMRESRIGVTLPTLPPKVWNGFDQAIYGVTIGKLSPADAIKQLGAALQ
jgi:maltose-binding protein MalE